MGERKTEHLTDVVRAEQAVARLEADRDAMLAEGRATMGVTGSEAAPKLRDAIRSSGTSWYPLVTLSLLVVVDEFQRTAFAVLAPDISRTLGISRGAIGAMVALSLLALTLAALPMAAFVQRKPRRGLVAVATAQLWSITTIFTGLVRTPFQMLGIMTLDGASTGSTTAVHQPLLFDIYPPEVRVRGLSLYRAGDAVGRILAPALVAVLAGVLLLTWRGVFVVMGVLSLAAALFAIGLRDPGFGRWDTQRLREQAGSAGDAADADDVSLGFFEIVRRLLLIPTLRTLYVCEVFIGIMFIPLATYLPFFLEDRYAMGAGGRGLFNAGTAACSVVALLAYGPYGERLFRRDPAVLLRRTGVLFAVALVSLVAGVLVPNVAVTFLLVSVFYAGLSVVQPALAVAIQGIIPAQMRPHAAALAGIFFSGAGGLVGLLFLGGLDRRFGISGAIAALLVPGLIGVAVFVRSARTVNADLDRMIEQIVEEQELRALVAGGTHLPLLACRNIDFSYGQLQVLFDVSFTVDDGEMVALLGTNGAGKSTLLRVVSGLGLPSRGSVRYRGSDITFLDAPRRVGLGIAQIPGGKAIFPRLSVVENLRAYGFSLGRDARALSRGMDETFDAFPRLAERRNQPAGTLSGGEAQMLALGKAFLLKPRLLAIDELSLGLAPKIVGDLLEMVRRINASGTAIVLVEQSVNIALSLVDHAYFMEKGEIRFDGAADDLVSRGDLLRSVFLEGATQDTGA